MDRQRTTKIYFLANLLANLKKKNGISEDYKEGKKEKKKTNKIQVSFQSLQSRLKPIMFIAQASNCHSFRQRLGDYKDKRGSSMGAKRLVNKTVFSVMRSFSE